jgi:prephenate dehydrogenase
MIISIIGLGAIGGSFAMALQKVRDVSILGVDIDQETINKAQEQHIIQHGSTDATDVLPEADIVLLSLYPSQIAPFIQKYKEYFKENTVLTDVTGVKTTIIQEVEQVLRDDLDFIFAHPMRGSEQKGFIGADASRFEGANALITPTSWNKEENLQLIEQLYKSVGFTTITRVSPEQHDEQIAYVSQLMHALSVSVVNSAQASDETLIFAGNSFRELTRIADINEELWSELFLNNQDDLIQSISLFEQELKKLKKTLEEKDEKTLKELFQQSRSQRRKWFTS